MSGKNENPQTPPQLDLWEVLNRIAAALENAKQSAAASNNDQLMEKLTNALVRVSESQVEGAKIIASETRRAHRPSNEVVHNRSVFNRRGVLLSDDAEGPRKMPLKCVMLLPWIAEWESLTREEVDLLNLLQPGEYTVALIDRTRIKMGVTMEYKLDGVTPSRLIMTHLASDGQPGTAFNNDNFRMMPALSDWLRDMLKQHSKDIRARAAAVLSDEEEEALIEAGELTVSL